jgi:NAD(P)-dependent dehydrogenase (short-subunit alcohol dehydrogenase family)
MSAKQPVVVITGASSGIGRATALRFAKEGAQLVLASRRGDALEELVAECEARGSVAIAVPTDVSSEAEVAALKFAAVETFGRIDVWVNDAAVSVYAPFATMPLDDFRRVVDVNLLGVVYGSRAALEMMLSQGEGVLINVASIIGEIAQPYSAPYGMTKAAVRALGVTLRSELALQGQKKIKVVSILPATIDTPFFRHAANYTGRRLVAMPPVYTPERVARAIVRSVSRPRAEIVVGPAGKSLFKQHRRTPEPVELQLAIQTDKSQFDRKFGAADSSGILYDTAPSSEAEVTGGWGGAAATRRRRFLTWGLLLGGGVFVVRKVLSS